MLEHGLCGQEGDLSRLLKRSRGCGKPSGIVLDVLQANYVNLTYDPANFDVSPLSLRSAFEGAVL
jgi:hypothetical protein